MIEISLEKRCLTIDPITGALAQAVASRAALSSALLTRLEQLAVPYTPLPGWSVHPHTMRALVRRYSVQAASYPLEEVAQWFAYQRYGLFLLPGYQPRFFSHTEQQPISPPRGAIDALGEACLGLLLQYLYQGRLLARPVAAAPHVVCVNPTTQTLYLGAVQATAEQTVEASQRLVDRALPRFLPLVLAANTLHHSTQPILGLLVGITLLSHEQWHCALAEVRVAA
ncbi:hypothetical protein [Stenomitos frigidus]|uniref:Uncharacterized protein n=1 Tax=Stenomitos frigidus ULC18 TaxID=2107698 RepID=A0A2T1ELS6_9CYAN|nr:hypothetical protein [Stenomitos frigidus]PSB33699.1 hypothetical protein C7B82_04235 [Stenomitos frigidus ULC18]